MTKKLLAAVIAVAVLVVVAACGSGGGVPSDSVATVDGTSIKKTDFDHWMTIAAKQQAVPGTAAAAPDPPNYPKCVAALQKQPVAKGQAKPTVAALKAQCAQQYDGLKTQVMQFLIQSQWLLQEASARKLTAKPATVQKQLDDQIKQSFPKQADFQNFLKSSGMSMQDLLFRVKIDVLTQQVRQKIVAGHDKVSDAQIQAYYTKNQARFSQPERRDLLVVLTKTEAAANKAKAALESGTPWATVAKKYSIDQASKSQGGKLPGVAKGQQEKSFDSAIFGAKKGVVVGPVKTQFGYYVFKVTAITKASQQTAAQAHDTILNIIRSQQEQNTLNKFVTQYHDELHEEDELREGLRHRQLQERSEAEERRQRRHRCHRRRLAGSPPVPFSRSTRSHAACAATAPGTASRTSARSCRIRWRRRTSSPTPRNSGDDAKLLDELGDVLFQVYFLSLLLEERGQGDLAAVADHCRQQADPPPPARVRRRRGRRRRPRCCATGTRSSAPSRGVAARRSSTTCPRTCPRCSTRAS